MPLCKCKKFDELCEVFTDKLVAKIPSTFEGYIKQINYKSDEICLVTFSNYHVGGQSVVGNGSG